MSGVPVTLADITSASWSVMLDRSAGGGAGSGIGRVVQALDDIGQCIAIILTTLPGEDPFRPTFGVDLLAFVDRPSAAVAPAIVGVVTEAIERWEPRVVVLGVSAAPGGAAVPGKLTVRVQWQVDTGGRMAQGGAAAGVAAPQVSVVVVE